MRSYRTDPGDCGSASFPTGWRNHTRGSAPPRPRRPPSHRSRLRWPRRQPLLGQPPGAPSPSPPVPPPAARGPSLAASETFVAARVVLPGPVGPLAESAWPGAMIVCRKDARFSAADVIVCRRGRYADPNYPLRAMCPACLLSVVPVGTLCRCPGTAGHLPGEDHDVGAGPAPTPSRRSLATGGE
jgi:hypothetical protein